MAIGGSPKQPRLLARAPDLLLERRQPDRADHDFGADDVARRAVEPQRFGDVHVLLEGGLGFVPGHVLLAADGTPKISDFGLAKTLDADVKQTRSGAVVGTPAYMAPEQAEGGAIDSRADLFSLGAVLYRMVTGEPPCSITLGSPSPNNRKPSR